MARAGPPAYAWDWFARQRLLWREARLLLSRVAAPVATRYAAVDARSDVIPMLRADYPRDEVVRSVVDEVVRDIAFLGRTDGSFADLGIATPPRGLRWWWTALTGEDLEQGTATPAVPPNEPSQLTLEEVQEGYGG